MEKKKIVLFALLSMLAHAFTVATLLMSVFIVFGLMICIPIRYGQSRYLETDGFVSPLVLFPESIESKDVLSYFYYKRGESNQVFLKIKFDEDGYYSEISRLEAMEYTFRGMTKKVMCSNELFQYESVIASYSYFHKYEYCLFDIENLEIIYIFFDNLKVNECQFDLSYLPLYYIENKEYKVIESDSFEYTIYSDYPK